MAEILSTIKHVVHFMSNGRIRLSRQDAKFIANVLHIFQSNTNITSNQVRLFNHILRKHERQFAKHELAVNQLIALPWNIPVVESTPQYTDAHLSIIDEKIILRSPYNTKFLKYLREQPNNEMFFWNKSLKQFEATFNIILLKFIIDATFKYYETVHCCDIIIHIMDELVQYDNIKYWDPTLVKVNDQYLIAATNASIDDVVKNIVLSDDPYMLCYLTKHAINIDESLLKTPLQQFAGTYTSTFDYENSQVLANWLVEIKCDGIYLENAIGKNGSNLKHLISLSNIPLFEMSVWQRPPTPKERGFTNPVVIKGLANNYYSDNMLISNTHISKIITIVNNNPVKIKK